MKLFRYIALAILAILIITTCYLAYQYFILSKSLSPSSVIATVTNQVKSINPLEKYSKIEVTSRQPGLTVRLNDPKYLQDYINGLGFYSSSGYTIPNASQLPSYVPKKTTKDTIALVNIIFGYYDSPASANMAIVNNEIKVITSSSLTGSRSLSVNVQFYSSVVDYLKNGTISSDDLNKAVNLQLLFYLAQISGKYNTDQLAALYDAQINEVAQLASNAKLPVVVNIYLDEK